MFSYGFQHRKFTVIILLRFLMALFVRSFITLSVFETPQKPHWNMRTLSLLWQHKKVIAQTFHNCLVSSLKLYQTVAHCLV